jgi:hypothetical protein
MGHTVKRCPSRILTSVTQTNIILSCVECQRSIRESEAKRAGWFYWSDAVDLHLICALCAAREFAADAPASAGT